MQGDGNLINSHAVNRIVITNQVNGKLRTSTLIIENVGSDDAGTYICRNTEQVHAEVAVRVLNGKRIFIILNKLLLKLPFSNNNYYTKH